MCNSISYQWFLHNFFKFRVQVRIAKRGLEMLQVGGLMAYSTCSFNPAENEATVANLLEFAKGWFWLRLQFLKIKKSYFRGSWNCRCHWKVTWVKKVSWINNMEGMILILFAKLEYLSVLYIFIRSWIKTAVFTKTTTMFPKHCGGISQRRFFLRDQKSLLNCTWIAGWCCCWCCPMFIYQILKCAFIAPPSRHGRFFRSSASEKDRISLGQGERSSKSISFWNWNLQFPG